MLRPVRPAAGGTTVAQQARVLGLRAIARVEAQMDAVRVPAPDHPAAQRDDRPGGSRRNSSRSTRKREIDFGACRSRIPAAVVRRGSRARVRANRSLARARDWGYLQAFSACSLRLAAQDVALSRRKQGFESPRERQCFQSFSSDALVHVWRFGEFLGSKRCGTLADVSEHKVPLPICPNAISHCRIIQCRKPSHRI
jgi:hypothetical protein